MTVSVIHATNSGNLGNATSNAYTVPNATASGNTLLVGIQLYSATGGANIPTITSVSDGVNSFTHATTADASRTSTNYGLRTAFYYATGITGQPTPVITVVTDISTYAYITAFELSSGTAFDQAVGNTGATTSVDHNVNAGTLVPSAAGAFGGYLGNEDINGGDNWTLTGWTVVSHGGAGNGATINSYQTGLSASTAFSMPFLVDSVNWAASGIVMNDTSGGPAALSLARIN